MENETRKNFLKKIIGLAALGVVSTNVSGSSNIPDYVGEKKSVEFQGQKGKRWGMVIDLRKCVGCQSCTVSCMVENNIPEGFFRTVVSDYEVVRHDQSRRQPLPRLCNHCEHPSCVTVCPTQATYQRDDGVVIIDNDVCIGCAACVQNCPYDARFINPETNTADKCTFCVHRVDQGFLPACVETCVGGARVFGDLNDPESDVSLLIKEHSVQTLKPATGNEPQVFYIGLDSYLQDRPHEGLPTLFSFEKLGLQENTSINRGDK